MHVGGGDVLPRDRDGACNLLSRGRQTRGREGALREACLGGGAEGRPL